MSDASAVIEAVPCEFFCEHSHSRSRVLALVTDPARPPYLQAVLTCTDPRLAQRAANVLTAELLRGRDPRTEAEAERISAELPDAPAASFRDALEAVRERAWAPTPSAPTWHELGLEAAPDDGLPESSVIRIHQLVEVELAGRRGSRALSARR